MTQSIPRAVAVTPNRRILGIVLLVLLAHGVVIAQDSTRTPTDGYTPLSLAPGAPAGSYPLSGFDNINPYNRKLNFSLPLKPVVGRGGAQYTMQLFIEQRWRVVHDHTEYNGQSWDGYSPDSNWWAGLEPGYGPGVLEGRQVTYLDQYCPVGSGEYLPQQTLTRLTFTTPDGTEYELRDVLTDGQPAQVSYCSVTPANRGKVFKTADGTSATFISDDDIIDPAYITSEVFVATGYLLMKDGTRYRIDGGKVTWMRDRNGNKLSFSYDSFSRITSVTDSLNRQIIIEYNVNDVAPYGLCDRITYRGFDNTQRRIRVSRTNMGSALRSGQTLKTLSQLWPELNNASSSTYYDPSVVSKVWLPNDQSYKFFYNSYGELARAELPTGGAYEYDWAAAIVGGPISGVDSADGYEKDIFRRVIERREYANGTTLLKRMTISRPLSTTGNLGYVIIDHLTASNARLSRTKHYYFVVNGAVIPTDYPSWKQGKEYKTEIIDTNGTTVLRRVGNTWQQPVAGSTWPLTPTTIETGDAKPNDPQITQTLTTLADTNQMMKQTFGYDKYSNRTDVYEYDYGSGAAGSLVRRTHTDYLTTNSVGGTTYNYAADTSIHLRSLPKQTSIYDAAGIEQARNFFEYDNYTTAANHAGLDACPLISGQDSAYTTAKKTRGNVTAVTRYLLNSSGTVTGSVSTYQQYDVAGNVVKAIDGLGNETAFTFTDSFGGPDAEAHANSTPPELSPQSGTLQSYAFPSLVMNDKGHTFYTQRDYYTGMAVDAEDPNGVTSSAYYNDILDRPTKVIRAASDAANNTALRNQTLFAYDDNLRVITVSSDFDAFNDTTPLKTQTLYDGLGRTTETRTFETASTFIAVRKTYDALGRVNKVSNPFRSGTPSWTTTAYDALGRMVSVTTPDNAAVTTSYSGNATTVTDQMGKDRQSTTDALGRLTQIIEDPGTGGLGYITEYTYDVLGNLRKVKQDTQNRYFMYDSLSRLIRVKNPEQDANASLALTDPVTNNSRWSIGYTYDDNNNLATRTDARNLTTTYTYDSLNRNTLVTYKSGTVTQARAERTYDTATNGVGRLAASYYYIDAGANVGANSQTAVDGFALGAVTAAIGGPKLISALLLWGSRNPDKVQQAAQGLLEMAGGPPGLTLAPKSRLTAEEISTGQRLAKQLGWKLEERAHIGAEYVVAGAKNIAIDAMGTPQAYQNWGAGKQFFASIVRHVNKVVDYVAIDLKGASQTQIKDIEKFVSSLPPEQRNKIVFVR